MQSIRSRILGGLNLLAAIRTPQYFTSRGWLQALQKPMGMSRSRLPCPLLPKH